MLKQHHKIIFFVLFLALFFPVTLWSATMNDLQSQIKERESQITDLEAEIQEYQKTLNEVEARARTLNNDIAIRNTRIKKLSADIQLAERNIQKSELTIQSLVLEIQRKELDIRKGKQSLAELLRTMHEQESETLIEVFLAHEKISDFFGDVEFLENLDSAIQVNLKNLQTLKMFLEEEKSANENEKTKLSNYQQDLSARKIIEEDTKQEKASLLKDTKQEESRYQQILTEREKLRASILIEINNIEAELARLIDPNKLPPKGTVALGWPLQDPYITQQYGFTAFAAQRTDIYKGSGHNGIDFRANIGTPIFAAADGEVMGAGNTDLTCPGGSYGKWIVIKHTNNLATLYAHLSLVNVQKGQTMIKGQRIAYSGDSGYTTGPHLHFTVYDASTVRFVPSASGRCKYQPYGGSINPMDYLPSM